MNEGLVLDTCRTQQDVVLSSELLLLTKFNLVCEALKSNTKIQNLKIEVNASNFEELVDVLVTLKSLTSLNLYASVLKDAPGRVSELFRLSNLLHLNMSCCKVGTAGAYAIAEKLKENNSLLSLNLSFNSLRQGFASLAQVVATNHTLEKLDIAYNKIRPEDFEDLGRMIQFNKSITKLDLSRNSVGIAGAQVISNALQMNPATLRKLNICYSVLHAEGARWIARGLRDHVGLTYLEMSRNSIDDAGAVAVAKMLQKNATLTFINLKHNQVKREGAKAIAASLHLNKTLKTLMMSENEIGSDGANALAQALAINQSMTRLDVSHNYIFVEGGYAMSKMLLLNKTLKSVDLSNNFIDTEGYVALAEACKINSTLSCLKMYPSNSKKHPLIEVLRLHNGRIVEADENDDLASCCDRNRSMHARAKATCLTMLVLRNLRPASMLQFIPKEMVRMVVEFLWLTRTDIDAWSSFESDLKKLKF